MFTSKKIEYHDQEVLLEGYAVFDQNPTEKKPAVLVFHDWTGRSEFACRKAEKLAALGYVTFAADMYGKDKLAKSKEEKTIFMQPLIQNRPQLQQRVLAAFAQIKDLPGIDHSRIAAIGYCFGGLCALDLARSGADIKAAISFHGLLTPPTANSHPNSIKAKILALHGYEDKMVPPEQITAFADEMNKAKADWQINMYGHAMHAFAIPTANDPALGTVYNKTADTRSWIAMQNFLQEAFQQA